MTGAASMWDCAGTQWESAELPELTTASVFDAPGLDARDLDALAASSRSRLERRPELCQHCGLDVRRRRG